MDPLADSLAKTGEAAKAGPIGLAVILLLCIACYFLFKSMSKHMRRVRENFPADEAGPEPEVKPEPGVGDSVGDSNSPDSNSPVVDGERADARGDGSP